MSSAIEKPWDLIPNPFSFPPLGEQVKQIHQVQPRGTSVGAAVSRRTAHAAKDWLGQSFAKGDLILSTGVNGNSFLEVEEIFLDDGKDNPYTDCVYQLYLEQSTQRVYWISRKYDYTTGTRKVFIHPLDPEWIGTHLGLILPSDSYSSFQEIPRDFVLLGLQSCKIRARPLVGDSKRRSLNPSQITAVGKAPLTRELTELYLKAREIPLIGDPIEL